MDHQRGARTALSQQRRVHTRRSSRRRGGLSRLHSFPRAVPAGVQKKGLPDTAGPSQRLQSVLRLWTGRCTSSKGAPWAHGAARDHHDVSGEAPPFRANRAGKERDQGAAAMAVETSLDPRCVSDKSATTQEGDKQGLACRPSVGLSFWGEGYCGVVRRTCGR